MQGLEQTPNWDQVTQLIGTQVIKLFGPLTILIIGWLVALIVSSLVREVLQRTSLDNRLARLIFGEEEARTVRIEYGVARVAYYLIMLFVLVAFFQALGLTVVTEPLNRFLGEIFTFAPRVLSATGLLVIAWVLAGILRRIIHRVLEATEVDQRLGTRAGLEDDERPPLTKTISEAVFWIVVLLFLPAVLNVLALEALFRPLESMINRALGFLPNLLGALLILVAGWFIARIVQRIVTNLLAVTGLDALGEKVGLSAAFGRQKLSNLTGLIAYGLLLLPVVIAALNALHLDAITRPASEMLASVLAAIPLLFGAGLLMTLAYFVGKLVSNFLCNLLTGVGFDDLVKRMGFGNLATSSGWTPSRIVGAIAVVVILLFASIEALRLLGFLAVADLIGQFTVFGGRVLIAFVIFAVGLFLAGLASKAVMASGTTQASLLAVAAQISVVVLASAMALREMGLANEIIDLAFGLLLGAVTIAIALAFGLGGRDVARQELEEWVRRVKSRSQYQGRVEE